MNSQATRPVSAASAVGTEPPQLLEADELARALGLAKHTIYRWGKAGRIPAIRLGRKVRYILADVIATLRAASLPSGETVPPKSMAVVAERRTVPKRVVRSPQTAARKSQLSHEERVRAALEATRGSDS